MGSKARGGIGFLLVAAMTAATLIVSPVAEAASFPAANVGYFTGGNMNDRGASHVLADPCSDGEADSVPSFVSSKDTFVKFIKTLYYNSYGGEYGYSCGRPANRIHNQKGAAFIIQTMRSDGTNYELSYPSNAAVDEWAAKVMNYKGSIGWNVSKDAAGVNDPKNPPQNSYYATNSSKVEDVAWHLDVGTASKNGVIVFYDTEGNKDYMIKRNCGNPMGKLDGLKNSDWSLSASSTVNAAIASPNQTVRWTHTLRNDGPGSTNATVHSNLLLTGFSNGWGTGPGEYAAGDVGAGAGVGTIRTITDYTTYRVTQSDVGNSLCQTVRFDPANSSGGRNGRGNTACVIVPFNFNLTPTVTSSLPATISAGTNIDLISGTIANGGPTRSLDNTIWQLTRTYVSPGSPIPGDTANNLGTVNATAPCATAPLGDARFNGNFFAGGGAQCASLVRSTGTGASIPLSGQTVSTANYLIGDTLPVGTKVCFALSVRNRAHNDASWYHSEPRCIVVAKQPKVQVLGGDLIVGRGYNSVGNKVSSSVVTSINTLLTTNKSYGSWSQYGIIPSGTVTGMASGAGFVGGASSTNLCAGLSLLTFANSTPGSTPASCSAAQIGRYSLSSPSPAAALSAQFSSATAPTVSGSVNVTNLAKNATYKGSGATISLSASAPLAAGQWVIIHAPNSTVRITSNLQYTNASLGRIQDIPQLVIVAKNISIAESVTQVDAWLIATGTGADGAVNTCDTVANGQPEATLKASVCAAVLRVNGPVVANHLYLYRTAGSGPATQSGDPAEVFNVRPDAYIWLSQFQGAAAKAQTVMTTELPPRF